MNKRILFLSITLGMFSSSSLAEVWQSMSKKQIEQAFVNKTWTTVGLSRVNGKTMPNNTFTGHLDDQGHFSAKFSQPINNGPQSDQGTYQIQDSGKVCMRFRHWNEAKEFCTHVYQTQDAYIVVGVENKLHNVILKVDVKPGSQIENNR